MASGDVDLALALGVEKMTDKAGHDVTAALATAADADYEVEQGVSFVGLNGDQVRYMHEYGWKHGDFAPFSINAHANAVHNPYARLRDKISLEKFERASMIATPINFLDASPIGDGAAAAVLVPAEKVKSLPGRPRGGHRGIGGGDRYDRRPFAQRPLVLTAARSLPGDAKSPASRPTTSTVRVHNAFSIMSALSLEACGFADAARVCDWAWKTRYRSKEASRYAPEAGSRPEVTRSAPPACTRSWNWFNNCGVNAAVPRWRSGGYGPEHRGKRRFDPHPYSSIN